MSVDCSVKEPTTPPAPNTSTESPLMAKVEILALAAGLPRTDLAHHQLGPSGEAKAVLQALFTGRIGAPLPKANLLAASYPEYGRIYAGIFGPAVIVCGQDLLELTDLGAAVAKIAHGRNTFRLQMNSEIDSVAMEIIGPEGDSVREVMLVAAEGVIFDSGPRLDFEQPYWSGAKDPDRAFAALNGREMPFDIVDFGEEALRTLFGFVIDAEPRPDDIHAAGIELFGFVIAADSADRADLASLRYGGSDLPSLGGSGTSDATSAAGSATPGTPAPETAGAAKTKPNSWWGRLMRQIFPE